MGRSEPDLLPGTLDLRISPDIARGEMHGPSPQTLRAEASAEVCRNVFGQHSREPGGSASRVVLPSVKKPSGGISVGIRRATSGFPPPRRHTAERDDRMVAAARHALTRELWRAVVDAGARGPGAGRRLVPVRRYIERLPVAPSRGGGTRAVDERLESAPPPAAGGADAPSLFTSVQEQLGLKLVAVRAPVSVLVIDAAARPTPN